MNKEYGWLKDAWPRLPLGVRLRILWVLTARMMHLAGWDWGLAIIASLAVSLWGQANSELWVGMAIFFSLLNCFRATILFIADD